MKNMNHRSDVEQEIIEMEKQWNGAIQRQDESAMERFLADTYFLAIGVQGLPLQIMPRDVWLANLKVYKIESLSIDDMQVHSYGNAAVVTMLFTQRATVRGKDRSGQFMLTDIWIKQNGGWRVSERHSSRPEPQSTSRPFEAKQ